MKSEDLQQYLMDELVPEFLKKYNEEIGEAIDKDVFLCQFGLETINPSTIYRWLKLTGFKQCPAMQCYYCDGHEKEKNVIKRGVFIQEYLENELQCH